MQIELNQWDLLAIETGLRLLQASGKADHVSLGFLIDKIANADSAVATQAPALETGKRPAFKL